MVLLTEFLAPGPEPRLPRLEDKSLHCAGGQERRDGDPGGLPAQVQGHQGDGAAPVTEDKQSGTSRERVETVEELEELEDLWVLLQCR